MACFEPSLSQAPRRSALVNAAHAADVDLPPAPPLEDPAPATTSAPLLGGGWYLRGDVGYGFDQTSGFSSNLAGITPGFQVHRPGIDGQTAFGGGVGYQLNNWFRADVTAEYRTSTHYSNVEKLQRRRPFWRQCLQRVCPER